MKRLLVIGLTLGLTVGLGGTAFAQEDTVTIGIGAEPLTLLGSQVVDWTTAAQIENIYDTLLTRDSTTLEVVPWLATDYEVIDENTLELTLREASPFTTANRLMPKPSNLPLTTCLNPENGSMWEPRFNRISEVEIVDDFTVRILTSEPFPALN